MSNRGDPVELLQLIRLQLLNNNDVRSMVGERIHTAHFMSFDDPTRQLPCVILEIAGGDMNYGQRLEKVTVYVYTYSAQNSAESLELYHKCSVALHAQRVSNASLTLRGLVEEVARPSTGYNDAVRSWYARGSFLTLVVG